MSAHTRTLPSTRRLAATGAALAGLAVLAVPSPAPAAPRTATYEVAVTNLTNGQPFTPPAWAAHRPSADVFAVGEPASEGVREIAENGNLAPLVAALGGARHVTASGVALRDGAGPPPVLPGETRTVTFSTSPSGTRLSLAAMLICTNDGFTGADTVRLPRRVGARVDVEAFAYDAGSEVNTEDFADIVPPCQGLIGVGSDDAGTGMSDPALAEGGVIGHHAGIVGGEDLQVGVHGWDVDAPVAAITIERVG